MSFHRFNVFTGRLRQSSQSEALYPISPNPLQTTEAPKMMFDSIKTKVVKTTASSQRTYSTLDPKMIKLQQKYQADLSKPVYLLGGKKDKIFFGISIAFCVVGFIGNAYYMRQLMQKY